MEHSFVKMHGLGNDFVIFDARKLPLTLSADQAEMVSDRRLGVGCDQILIIHHSDDADIKVVILNSDGSEAAACGNGSRCVADLVMRQTGQQSLTMDTKGGLIRAWREGELITIDMGPARLDWQYIPLAAPTDTARVDLGLDGIPPAVCVNMGNPHAVHFVEDAEKIDLHLIGPKAENHPVFPDRANIEFASPLGDNRLRMRVWERGVGITRACGTGACAVAVAAAKTGRASHEVEVVLDGGSLTITWQADGPDAGHVFMRGPTAYVFTGQIVLAGKGA